MMPKAPLALLGTVPRVIKRKVSDYRLTLKTGHLREGKAKGEL